VDARQIGELRSVAYHRAVAARLLRDPALLEVARRRVRDWLVAGEPAAFYAEAWDEILARPVEDVAAFIETETEQARALRQVTPFAGFLDPRERWRIWREVRAQSERSTS
jgi:hypothetical protein